jgi:hypothetical protein
MAEKLREVLPEKEYLNFEARALSREGRWNLK